MKTKEEKAEEIYPIEDYMGVYKVERDAYCLGYDEGMEVMMDKAIKAFVDYLCERNEFGFNDKTGEQFIFTSKLNYEKK